MTITPTSTAENATTVAISSQLKNIDTTDTDLKSRTNIAIAFLTPTLIAFTFAWFYTVSRTSTVLSQARNVTILQIINIFIVVIDRSCCHTLTENDTRVIIDHRSSSSSKRTELRSLLVQ